MPVQFLSEVSILSYVLLIPSDNILITSPWTDSIVYPNILLNIASLLADSGHNVTFLALGTDQNVPENIDYLIGNVSREDNISLRDTEYLHEIAEQSGALAGPSSRLITQSVVGSRLALEKNVQQLKLRFDYLMSEEVSKLFRSGNFSLVIAEETAFHPIALQVKKLVRLDPRLVKPIPIVTVLSIADQHRSRIEQNLPTLLTSEAGQFLNIYTTNSTPDFFTRLSTLWEIGHFAWQVVPKIMSLFSGYLEEVGLESLTQLDHMTSFYLVNDHPALSFPNLAPPNSVNIASLNYKTPKALPLKIAEFLGECDKSHVALVIFGETAYKSSLWREKETVGKTIIEALQRQDFCVISNLKDKNNKILFSNTRMLISPNLPVEDIMSLGNVSFFISQCGNKQRILGVLYQVPMLCVPLFADQFSNSLAVSRNKFGEMLLREDMSRETVGQAIRSVLGRSQEIQENLAKAAVSILLDPSGSKESVLFYCNHLLKFGNVDYLRNEVIFKQSTFEVYNLDIVGLLVFLIVLAAYSILLAICVCCRFVKTKIREKLKND